MPKTEAQELRTAFEKAKAEKDKKVQEYIKGIESIKRGKAREDVKREKRRKSNTAPRHKPQNVVTHGYTPMGVTKKTVRPRPKNKYEQMKDAALEEVKASIKAVERYKKDLEEERRSRMSEIDKRLEDTRPHKHMVGYAKRDFDISR